MLLYLKTQGGWREAHRDLRMLETEPAPPIELRVLSAITEIRITRGSEG